MPEKDTALAVNNKSRELKLESIKCKFLLHNVLLS
jgi:hypothetical protein